MNDSNSGAVSLYSEETHIPLITSSVSVTSFG